MRTLISVIVGGLLLAAGPASAQSHGHGPGQSPAGPSRAHLGVQRFWEQYDTMLAEGRGFGIAFVADRNGYPGPLHVLELADTLKLTPEQETRVGALQDAMLAEARPQGVALLEAEQRLGRLFADGHATEETVRAQAGQVERLRGEVRLVHLRYHLKTRELLTEPQRATYHAKRWGTGG